MIDIETLIAAKRAAGRPKDLLTIKHLEAVKRLPRRPPPAPERGEGANP